MLFMCSDINQEAKVVLVKICQIFFFFFQFQIRERVGPPARRESFQIEELELEETVEVGRTKRCC